MSRLREERGLVGKAIVITLIVLAIVGVIGVDAASVIFARVHVDDVAEQVALEAARQFKGSDDQREALQAAVDAVQVQDPEVKLTKFSVNAATGEVTVSVRKPVSTLVFKRFSATREFAVARATVTRGPPTL